MKTFTFLNIFFLGIAFGYTIVLLAWLHFDHLSFNPYYFLPLGLGIWAILIMFQYRALRKKEVFWAWVILSALLFGLSFWLKQDKQLILPKTGKSAALELKAPLCVLISYRIFSWIARKTFSTELILPSRIGSYDQEEGRYPNNADLFAVFSYIAIIALASQY